MSCMYVIDGWRRSVGGVSCAGVCSGDCVGVTGSCCVLCEMSSVDVSVSVSGPRSSIGVSLYWSFTACQLKFGGSLSLSSLTTGCHV